MAALATSLALVVVWWRWIGERPLAHIDHRAFLRTQELMRAGEGYYAAMRQAFLDIDVTIGHARGYRLPTPFWFWELFPADLLYGVFLLVVVVGSLVLLTRITTTVAALPWVTLVLLYAGRSTGFADEANWEAWMLVELWVVPLILGTVVAWRSRRDGWAAALAAAATLCRETAAVLLIGGLIAAVVDRRPWRPWAVSSAATGLAYLAHVAVASGYADPPGTFAQLFGTGDGIDTVLYMTMWNLPGPVLIGAALWALGCWRLWHRPERWLLAPLFALPLTGVLVHRPYWGILLIPLMVTFAVEQVVTLARGKRNDTKRSSLSDERKRRGRPDRCAVGAEA